MQSNIGIAVGMIAFGVAMGALFAVVYCVFYGRFSSLPPAALALVLAGAMFFSLYLVPFLKYPANPPSIGHGETISARTGLYLTMVVASVLTLVLAVWIARKLEPRFGAWTATLMAGGGFIVVIAIVMLLLPSLGHLGVNASEYGNYATETPSRWSIRRARSCFLDSRPTTCISSGFTPLVHNSFCGRRSAWDLRLWLRDCLGPLRRDRTEAAA